MIDVDTIISVIESIYDVYAEVKANPKRCARLCERLRALESALKELKNQNSVTQEKALEITLKVVQDAKKLVEKFTTAKWYIKVYGAATGYTKDEFEAINERLQGCVQALHLTATVKVLFNTTEEDKSATHEDMKEMQLLLESLEEERGQTQEDLVAINTALDKVGIEIQNEFIVINDQLRRGNQNQAAMMQKMEKQEILLQQLLKKDEQRVQQSQKPKVTVLELNSNDIIFGEFIGRGGFGVVYKGTWNGVATVLELNSNDIIFGEFIGRGGFGVVYKGTWNGAPVALKTFPSNAVDAKTREDLRKEALKHQRMKNHPNIISFYGVCLEPSDKACLVIEFASGGTLFDRIYKIDIDISTPLALAYAFELVAGLVHLHKNSICHRDLKSLNVLIAAGGILKLSDFGLAKVKSTFSSATSTKSSVGTWAWILKLSDFGLAKVKSTFSSATSTKSSVGTWAWMAPEQHDDDPKVEIDWEKNDVYSLGMVLFEIVTKKQPWDGLNPTQIIRAVLDKKKRPEIATSDESRHKVLVAILKKCWNQDATQRPSLKNGDIQERIATTLKQLGGDPRQAANVVDISPAVPVSINSSQKQKPPPPPRHVPEPPRPTQSSAVQNIRLPEHLLSRWEWLRKLADNDRSLTELKLSSEDKIGDEGAKAIATTLATNTSLQLLQLGGNNIGNEGAIAIANALATNTSLQALWLHDSNFGVEGAKALATALGTN
eukprot:CAMPEP_0197340654 /NCGR_PEP_ID=MMETSP0892-20130614/45785_1 /TAXON_ID=44058 ORGANISM="Aureoumbra lagunensis, Strain CCMP1510" /NCGR_SAMPLE_ID=MMETSP0892 /ASSEMBLY_ACC=CAM_ASM_000538 /LENGTH=719 /DNA_ID=CAMNT_0042845421 /DNA_START=66 /DNA_END=2222 /DNA_ORIENTATION=+